MVPVAGRLVARGTWHVPPRERLAKIFARPTGQTEGTADPKLTGHTQVAQLKILCGVAVPVGPGCTRQGSQMIFFDMGSSGSRKL